jgi:SAM-dependent methyltransferase
MFDIVCAFEVLEHLEDDSGALASWLEHLRPGGWALVSVPHGRHRFGPQDEWVGHLRRYDRADLAHLLVKAGLGQLEIVSYGFPLGNALEAARDALARRQSAKSSLKERTAASGRWLQPPTWTGSATRAVTFPFRLAQRPFANASLGTGLVARARRPTQPQEAD